MLNSSPQLSQAAKLRDGQELVGIRAQSEEQQASRGVECKASAFERAQIGDPDRKHIAEFLSFGASGIVDHAPIGGGEFADSDLERVYDAGLTLKVTNAADSAGRRLLIVNSDLIESMRMERFALRGG